jgi:squalene-hopene/tetraprenyl-beta-curcumene cyclase
MISALTEAGLPPDNKSIKKGADWLWKQQIFAGGDWATKTADLEPGGWAFQFENALYPDLDDTAMVLMALMRAGCLDDASHRDDLAKAVNWIIGMQSSDGGFAAFDIDNNYLYLNEIPFAAHGALLAPSTADLTARCIEVLACSASTGTARPSPRASSSCARSRRRSAAGSAAGRETTSTAPGPCSRPWHPGRRPELAHGPPAVDWLISCQNEDGGWGETCYSYNDKSWPAGRHNPVADRLGAATPASPPKRPTARKSPRGIAYLLNTRNAEGGWDEKHYTGTGFPTVFYLRYPGYSQFFPLWALGVYRRKIAGKPTRQSEVARTRPFELHLPALRKSA